MLPYWVEFFDELQNIRGRSLNTVLAYRRDLEIWDEFSRQHKKDIARIYTYLTERNLSVRSQARVISSIRTYLRFCSRQGVKVPQLRQLKLPKVRVSLPKSISVGEFEKLYNACETAEPYTTARNQVTLLLLFGVGCRVSELIALDIADFSATEGWLKVLGKGNKERLIPLTKYLQDELESYLREARQHLVKHKVRTLIINDRGNRPSRVDVWRWLRSWSKTAGFTKSISPHKLRHGCATALLEGGADLRSIQVLLGHSSIQTTKIYTNVTRKKIREDVDKHHPLSGVRIDSDVES